ncbi:hypothetical protein COT65_00025 [Candidatus Shapirobacteria bacterium CG09_land_8_20_14_0_10_47_13]|uniref:Regulatory protein RecX n=1 Tax=Candidatus Shapirobacteria bacterium CG09_land_8_20_14_0_10_47_13 TaxID=1974481 RepID=A0A2H0WNL6_9BACT|nr:MAG: hypothetical protein COT65_00025 [Candidatus Shapirobacteria bacterium CG09_land_8_20_14_0_10_47_13]
MAKISQISPQKTQQRVNIYLDGKFAFGLDLDNFLKSGLAVGQELTDQEVEKLVFKNDFQKLYDRVLRFISVRPRSRKEISDYLNRKKTPEKLVEKIIGRLAEGGLIDDEAFARWWVEQRVTFRPKGKRALLAELGQKGVDREISEKIIGEEIDEERLAGIAAEKKLRVLKNLPAQELRQKMTNFLLTRGFSWETVKKIVDEKDFEEDN